MGFIKHALIGIALYEGIKYWIKEKTTAPAQVHNIRLGGKHFAKTEAYPTPDAPHRHHLDRPEIVA